MTFEVISALRPSERLTALALAIVFASVYIGVHYVVDVVAGLLLAGLTLALTAPLARWVGSAPSEESSAP